MEIFKVDGVPMMLNHREVAHWVDTGNFVRIPEGDDEDPAYSSLRDRFIAEGNEQIYRAHCPSAM